MRLTRRKLNPNVSRRYSLRHDCTAAEDLSHMWSYHVPDNVSPLYGPQRIPRTLSEDELKRAISALVEAFRDLCIYDPRHKGITHIAVHHDEREDEIQRLGRRFYFNNSRLVREFLESHRSLVGVLFDVRKGFDKYFGEETQSSLEVFSDPEDNHSTPKLFALILTTLPSSDASTRLDLMDQEWWLNQPREVKRVLNIDVDYLDGSV